jgi:hypothetical protein
VEGGPTALNVGNQSGKERMIAEMKKLLFVVALMMLFAVPTMADDSEAVPIVGGVGAYCIIWNGGPIALNLGNPEDVGDFFTPAIAYVSTNKVATITVEVEDDKIIADDDPSKSLAADATWDSNGTHTDTTLEHESAVQHPYTIKVTRGGVGDHVATYGGVVLLAITCN